MEGGLPLDTSKTMSLTFIWVYGERGLSKCPFDTLVTNPLGAMQLNPLSIGLLGTWRIILFLW